MTARQMKILTDDDIEYIQLIIAEENWSKTTFYEEVNDYIFYNCPQIGKVKSKSTLFDFLDGKHGLFEPNQRRVKAWLCWYRKKSYIGENKQEKLGLERLELSKSEGE